MGMRLRAVVGLKKMPAGCQRSQVQNTRFGDSTNDVQVSSSDSCLGLHALVILWKTNGGGAA